MEIVIYAVQRQLYCCNYSIFGGETNVPLFLIHCMKEALRHHVKYNVCVFFTSCAVHNMLMSLYFVWLLMWFTTIVSWQDQYLFQLRWQKSCKPKSYGSIWIIISLAQGNMAAKSGIQLCSCSSISPQCFLCCSFGGNSPC